MSSPAEEPDVWFHGTRRGFTQGGVVLPLSSHGVTGRTTAPTQAGACSPAEANQWVYITRDLTLAWVYAWHAVGAGKPKVLTVIPHGQVERDPEHGWRTDAWRCEWASVTQVSTSPVIKQEQARAGWVT